MVQENIININNLLIKCDNNEQYSRRSFVFMALEVTTKIGWKRLKKFYNTLDLPFCEEEIDRVHRIGKENSGKKLNQLLSSLNRGNLDSNSATPDFELRRRNQIKTLLFQSI